MTETELYKRSGIDKVTQARFSQDYEYIVDSEGNKIEFGDPKIVFVSPEPRNPYGRQLVINLYKKYNRNIRISTETDRTILKYAKELCSGRECLASVAITGAVLKDIYEYRNENEITIYRTPIDQHGPCQNGAWPVLWESFAHRINMKNVIFYAFPRYTNNYLGLNADLIAWENINFFIGHYIIEAKNALQCIAENKTMALEIFESLTSDFIENVKEGKH